MLNPDEAAVLLSASLLWQKVARPVAPVSYSPPDAVVTIQSQLDTMFDSDAPERAVPYPAEAVPVRVIAHTDTSLTLGWRATPGLPYSLVRSTGLSGSSWEPVSGMASLSFDTQNAVVTVPIDRQQSPVFFRIEERD